MPWHCSMPTASRQVVVVHAVSLLGAPRRLVQEQAHMQYVCVEDLSLPMGPMRDFMELVVSTCRQGRRSRLVCGCAAAA